MVSASEINLAMEDAGLMHILYSIINVQSYQIHQFRNYLGGKGSLPTTSADKPPKNSSVTLTDVGQGTKSTGIVDHVWHPSLLTPVLIVGLGFPLNCFLMP